MCTNSLAVALLISVLSSAGFAQQPATSWDAIERARGKSVVVVRNDKHFQTGQLEQASGDLLTLSDHQRRTIIARDDVRRVYVRTSRSRKRGTLWGFSIGAGGGAIVGAATVRSCSSNSFCVVPISRAQGAGIGAVAGAAVGSIVGALVGGGRKKVLLYDSGAAGSGR